MTLSDWSNLASVCSFILTSFGLFKLWPMFREWKLRRDAWGYFVKRRREAGEDIYGNTWSPEPGSREFEIVEHLVERGMMFRRDFGHYGLWQPPEDHNDRW